MNKTLGRLTLALAVAEVFVVLLSWILSATMTAGVHSLLSGEGVRFIVGSFSDIVASWPLAWMLLIAIAWGCFRRSGLTRVRWSQTRDKAALVLVALEIVVAVSIVCLLSLTPHAPLLSSTGRLFPSAFSAGIVPMFALTLAVISISYGAMSGHFRSLAEIFQSMTDGVMRIAPLIVVYVFAAQLVATVSFMF